MGRQCIFLSAAGRLSILSKVSFVFVDGGVLSMTDAKKYLCCHRSVAELPCGSPLKRGNIANFEQVWVEPVS